jgi:diguanylate cyclase (GGDEF)-like protein
MTIPTSEGGANDSLSDSATTSLPMPELGAVPGTPFFPPESAYGAQLKRGFPWLRFARPLEEEFRQALRTDALPAVRRNLWIAIVFVFGFSWLTHMVLDAPVNRLLDTIRFAVFTPVLACGLVLVHSRWYHRFYPLACLAAAPIFGLGVTVIAVIAASYGVSLISSVVLVTIYIYLMLGMLFYPAMTAALIVFASYFVFAAAFELPRAIRLVDAGVLVFSNVIGAMVCYTLERANRTNFLEERLLTETASRDGLTGINNRRAFDEHVQRIWPQAIRDRIPLSLMLIDIDHFKAYNDYYGHQAGDECLRQVAWCLMRSARRPLDVTARYGGEEFAVVLYDAGRDHIEDVGQRIRSGIEALNIEHLASPLPRKRLTVSIGAACVLPISDRSHFGFIQLADEALYDAKEQGRDRVVIKDKEYAQLSTGSFRRSAAS